MRITDRSPTGRGLQTIFLPAEPRPVMPTEVSDEIVLTHPALPPMVGFKEGRFFFSTGTGALGANSAFGPQVPTDRYWWIQMLDVFHNDPVDRIIELELRDTSANRVLIQTSRVPIAANRPEPLTRPFLLGNDLQLVGRTDVMGAGQVVTLRFFFLEFLHAEINPTA